MTVLNNVWLRNSVNTDVFVAVKSKRSHIYIHVLYSSHKVYNVKGMYGLY